MSLQHYQRFANLSHSGWIHRASYWKFWSGRLIELLSLSKADRILDLGGGCGDLALALKKRIRFRHEIVCVDPSEAMLAVAKEAGLKTIHAKAEVFARSAPRASFDRIIMKQMIHHIPSSKRNSLYRELHGILAPGGRVAILTMPETILYPMFQAAIDGFEKKQIKHASLARGLSASGFRVEIHPCDYPVRISWERFASAVRERFISDLRPFSDSEIERGLREIRRQTGEKKQLYFHDRLVVFLGFKES